MPSHNDDPQRCFLRGVFAFNSFNGLERPPSAESVRSVVGYKDCGSVIFPAESGLAFALLIRTAAWCYLSSHPFMNSSF